MAKRTRTPSTPAVRKSRPKSAAVKRSKSAPLAAPSKAPSAPPGARSRPRSRDPAASRTLPIEIDPGQLAGGLDSLRSELVHWANKGRYTKVRFKFRGKPLLPDLPLAAVVAAEGLTFYWGGLLRALIVNVAGKSVFEFELVNESEAELSRGREQLLAGEVEPALVHFRKAQGMDRDNPRVQLNLGVALKLKGDFAGAREAFEKARGLDAKGPAGLEAERLLDTLPALGLLPR